jgi:hypothetical protein
MSTATPDGTLTAFWVSFPDDPGFPLGMGVTAWSEADARRLLEERGYDFHRRARRVDFRAVEKVDDLGLDYVSKSAGPIVVRGLWFPCGNVGFGAP